VGEHHGSVLSTLLFIIVMKALSAASSRIKLGLPCEHKFVIRGPGFGGCA